ncbi:MAG: aldehyde dehydrogenase family protein [Rhodobacterales bacterium]|nr:aldehyde dehydrogenase family protein [Rhodobacterales bacterium]
MRQCAISPVDGHLVERLLADASALGHALEAATAAQRAWRETPLSKRINILTRAVANVEALSDQISAELTLQIGRPSRYAAGEVAGFSERAHKMIALAPSALADKPTAPKAGFQRFVRREPVGVVLVLAPWNYPYLCAVNAVWPALIAGNSVLLKHSEHTPTCPEHIYNALKDAGLPEGVFQYLHLSHEAVAEAVADPRVDYIAFTGSVAGGRAVHQAAGGLFKAVGLELGGNDAGYVRADADLDFAAENLSDGAFFNSGQSCCGIERSVVHQSVFESFVEKLVGHASSLVVGDPREARTTMGPVIRTEAADRIRQVIAAAIEAGAKPLVDPALFPIAKPGTRYVAPQVLVNVTPDMDVVREEIFGPVVVVIPVANDAEAIRVINDDRYGLTASIWTADVDAALALADQIHTGTVFMNRCDYLDPELAWVGVKHSGRGASLSSVGFDALTRPKSFHLRLKTR